MCITDKFESQVLCISIFAASHAKSGRLECPCCKQFAQESKVPSGNKSKRSVQLGKKGAADIASHSESEEWKDALEKLSTDEDNTLSGKGSCRAYSYL